LPNQQAEAQPPQAAVLAQKARDQSIGGVIAQVLNIPVTCHPNHFPKERHEYTSFVQNSDASVLDAPKMNWFWKQYLPNGEPAVYASPLLAKSLKGLPPAREC
jgi:acetyl esterase/lipase